MNSGQSAPTIRNIMIDSAAKLIGTNDSLGITYKIIDGPGRGRIWQRKVFEHRHRDWIEAIGRNDITRERISIARRVSCQWVVNLSNSRGTAVRVCYPGNDGP